MQKFLHYDTAKEAPDIVSDTRADWPLFTISLYVDDGTIESSHQSSRFMQKMLAGATSTMIDICERKLQLEASAKKSVICASSLEVARGVASVVAGKAVGVSRSAKLLGTDSGGGLFKCLRAG